MTNIRDDQLFALLKDQLGLIGNSANMDDALHLLKQAAPTDLSVLITGETGTGKDSVCKSCTPIESKKEFSVCIRKLWCNS